MDMICDLFIPKYMILNYILLCTMLSTRLAVNHSLHTGVGYIYG